MVNRKSPLPLLMGLLGGLSFIPEEAVSDTSTVTMAPAVPRGRFWLESLKANGYTHEAQGG